MVFSLNIERAIWRYSIYIHGSRHQIKILSSGNISKGIGWSESVVLQISKLPF